IENMMSDGDSAEMWEVMVPLLNEFTSVSFGWVPGHMGILGNEAVDQRAKSSAGRQLRPVLWDGVSLGIVHAALARELRREDLVGGPWMATAGYPLAHHGSGWGTCGGR